jgi:class 3 adenylate cyclase/tetratricopeptide (TPR) repeat protein
LPADARFCPACGAAATIQSSGTGDERKLVTVLFADVTGSTALGEQLDPEHMREVLDRFFAAMRDEIEGEGGTVEKFIGDAVMAAFGVPTAHEDDPTRAVRAAMRMLRRLDDVNASLMQSHDVTLQVRIGVNTGEVLATTDPRPGEAMVTGDTVNAAARLQSAAEPGTVVIGERTARGARGSFQLEPLGPLELKGKAQPVNAFVVVEELEQASGRGVPGLHAPIVGRDSELELLRSIYRRAVAEGRPNLVTVYGDAGVGKSRLTQEFLVWLEGIDPAPRTMRGRCLPYGDGITYWPLAEILKSTASVLDTDPPNLVLEKIAKVSDDVLTDDVTADRARTTAALAYTVGVEDPAFRFGDMDPRDVRVEIHAAWRSFFSALGAATPTIAIIEDIHWADAALLDLLDELAEGVTGSVLFLCPARPELTSRRPGWGGGRRNFSSISLDPLGRDEAEHLIRALLSIDDLPDGVRSRILERGEGNPFFLEEILRHLIDGGHVFFEAGRWRADAAVAEVEIPDTVQGVLVARIDLLEPAAKRLLQGAAVVGRDFWPAPARLLGSGGDDVDATLRVLQDRDLIASRLSSRISGEREYTFKHVLTRDVAYESLPHRERPAAHARVAAWIEATAGDRVGEFNELLAYHFSTAARAAREGGTNDAESDRLRSKAFAYLLDASRDSRRREVLRKAQRMAEEAIGFAAGPLERSQALATLGLAYYIAGDGDPAWFAFREAAEVRAGALEPPDAGVADLSARACDMPTRWPGSMRSIPSEEEVRACLELGLSYLPEGASEERIKIQMIRATWAFAYPERGFTDEEFAGLERAGMDAYETAMQLGLPNLASAALDAAQSVPGSQGHWARAVEYSQIREKLLPDLTDLDEVGDATACAAWNHYEVGLYRTSERWASEGIRRTEGRAVAFRLHSHAWRCVARFRLGDWDAAMQDYQTIRDQLDERRDEPPYFAAHAYGAALLMDHARGGSAEMERLADLLSPLESTSEGRFTRLRPWLAMVSIVRGDFGQAHDRLDDLPAGWRVHGGEVLEARCELVRAEAAWETAPSILAESRAFAESGGLPILGFFADRLEGHALLEAGDADRAIPLLLNARDGFSAHEARYEQACTERVLAEVFRASDRPDEAKAASDDALREFERLGVVVPG